MTEMVPIDLLEARVTELRREIVKLQMQLVRYRDALEEAGIKPPDASAEELLTMWRSCRTVISTASEFVMNLGASKELLADWTDDAR